MIIFNRIGFCILGLLLGDSLCRGGGEKIWSFQGEKFMMV